MLEEVAQVHAAISTALAVTNSAVQLPLLAFGTEATKIPTTSSPWPQAKSSALSA